MDRWAGCFLDKLDSVLPTGQPGLLERPDDLPDAFPQVEAGEGEGAWVAGSLGHFSQVAVILTAVYKRCYYYH